MRVSLCAAIILLIPSSSLAEGNEFSECHMMATDALRVQCYDKATGYVKPTEATNIEPETVAPQPTVQDLKVTGQQWQMTTERSALHNREDVWLSVKSENTEGNAIGSPEYASLLLRCMENATNVLILFSRYTSDDQNVQYRMDDEALKKQWMEPLRGGEGIGIWSGSRAIPFIKGIVGKSTLILSYDTYEGPVEFSFNVSGLSERIEPLATACGWQP